VILLHYKFSISICYLKVWKFVMIQIRVPAIYFLLQTELVVASHHEGHQKTLLLLRRVVHSWDTLVASKSLWWLLLRRVVPIICDRSYRIGCNASLSLLPRTVHRVTDTSWSAPTTVPLCCRILDVQHMFVVLCERSKHYHSKHIVCPC
jgi:hypothetical protein